MKHPTQCIPNTLTILRNYWKNNENQQTTLQPMQPPQNGTGALALLEGPPQNNPEGLNQMPQNNNQDPLHQFN